MKVLIHSIFKRSLLISSCAVVAVSTGLSSPAYAAPTYNINKVLVAEDQYPGAAGVKPKPVYKPHEVAVHSFRGLWVSSNERTGFAGVTVFRTGSNRVLATLNIEEPDVEFAEEAEEEEEEH